MASKANTNTWWVVAVCWRRERQNFYVAKSDRMTVVLKTNSTFGFEAVSRISLPLSLI